MVLSDTYEPVPVTIISGFLGSGKTTLLNRILNGRHGVRVAVLVNDFGEINIDASLIVGIEGETISLSNGCICCNIRDDLAAALLDVVSRNESPEAILVETSGVSDPLAVASTLYLPEIRPLVRPEALLTLVDVEHILQHEGEEARLALDQMRCADILILNKTDLVSEEELAKVRAHVTTVAPKARQIETTYGQIPVQIVIGLEREDGEARAEGGRSVSSEACPEACDIEHDHAAIFQRWNYRTDQMMSLNRLHTVLAELPPTLYRLKGIFHLVEEPDFRNVLQVVGWRIYGYRAGSWGDRPRLTEAVAIGRMSAAELEVLDRRFDECRATPDDLPRRGILDKALSWMRNTLGGRRR